MRPLLFALLYVLVFPVGVRAQDEPAKDSTTEARLRQAWTDVREYWDLRREGEATDADDPQRAYAKEFFAYYQEHPRTPTGMKAGQTAFMMWGNLGAAEEVDQAVQQVPSDSELWSSILNGVGNAYARNERWDDYVALLQRLEDELTHPMSRSELLLALAEHHGRGERPQQAKSYYDEVVSLEAHPFHVQKAESALYEMDSLNVGQVAPDFTVETIDGDTITLSDMRGKVVLLEFWATSCGPCLPEIPHLKAMNERFSDADFQIIGVTEDEDLKMLREFLEERQMTWPQVQQLNSFEDEVLKQDEVLVRYNVFWIPRSFLINREGMIAVKGLRGDDLEEAVSKLVAREGE